MFSALSKWFWNIVAPPFCSWCREYMQERYPFCDDCLLLISPLVTESLEVGSYSIKVYTLGAYQDPLKRLILQKNYHNPIGSHQLGVLLATRFKLDSDLIIPVPSHWSRNAWRGFNHTEIIAKEIASAWHVQYLPLLKRHKKTEMQSTISVEKRKENVSNAFSIIDETIIKDKHLILVDDLMTTGSTIKECIKVLLKAKPKSIAVIIACRTV